jgi:hypothetical protein
LDLFEAAGLKGRNGASPQATSQGRCGNVIVGDSRTELAAFADGTFQACITSPPYWGLRDYGIKGQIGAEFGRRKEEEKEEEKVSGPFYAMAARKRVLTPFLPPPFLPPDTFSSPFSSPPFLPSTVRHRLPSSLGANTGSTTMRMFWTAFPRDFFGSSTFTSTPST